MSSLPATLKWAVWLLVGEAVAVGTLAGLLLYADLTATASDTARALAVTAYAVIMAGVLALLGLNLARRRKWPRAPAIAIQLLLLPIAYYLIKGGAAWLGIPVGALAITVTALLVTPATREALGIH